MNLHIDVQPVDFDHMSSTADGEPSEAIRERVVAARAIQNMRFASYPDVHCNAQKDITEASEIPLQTILIEN